MSASALDRAIPWSSLGHEPYETRLRGPSGCGEAGTAANAGHASPGILLSPCDPARSAAGTVALVDRGWSETGPVTAHRATSVFAGFQFPREVISVAVRWYLRYGLSYRDVEELLAERGVTVDRVSIYR